MSKKTAVLLVMTLCLAFVGTFIACSKGSDGSSSSKAAPAAKAEAPEETAGFEEFPLGDDIELGPLNVAGVYFQPVDMEPAGNSLPASQSDVHLEADISALEGNNLGYGAGDFVPNLTVRYEIEDSAGKVNGGSFMPMSASDGPHYGANVKIGKAGTYKIRFIIESPETQGYLLHTDKTTGVEGRFWKEPLIAEWTFDWIPRTW